MYELTRINNRTKNTDPFAQLARDFFGTPATSRRASVATHAPRFDFVETEDEYRLHADLPGIAEEDLEITVHEGVLSVAGSRSEESSSENSSFLVRERQYGTFERRMKLPKDANAEHVQAKLEAGVLVIRITKKEELKARKIELG
ncbi:MAG: Hsp20/alpha crystallin family protein [Myxococcales bacterium]|nr:Hsp20/alpha crystallin family protein [Myxococcales bacterium]